MNAAIEVKADITMSWGDGIDLSLLIGDFDKFKGVVLEVDVGLEITVIEGNGVSLEEENKSSAFEIITGSFG